MTAPPEFLQYIDSNADAFIDRLREAVSKPSVSGDLTRRDDVLAMGDWLNAQLLSLGVETKLADLGKQVVDGKEYPYPPAILGKIGDDPAKKTVLIYGHYDVQPADKADGWDTEPFTLVETVDHRLVGRGSTDDKGPILGWLNVLQYHHAAGKPLPVNLKTCFEGMEESDDEGALDRLIEQESKPGGWFEGVDCVCISDNYWLNTRTPVVTYGLRGISLFEATVTGPGHDLHSGVFGRTVFEPMTDLIYLLSKLVDSHGKILITGVDDMVPPPTEDERKIYEKLDYTIQDINDAAGGDVALSSDKVEVLMGRMRYPSLSLHGIEGAFSGDGTKTVIPAKVSGKFSIRLVPPQTPEAVEPLVKSYLELQFATLNTKNKLTVEAVGGADPWVANPNDWNYTAAINATKAIYNKEPDLTREGGSIPVTVAFAKNLGPNVSVVLLPMGRGDDGAHSTNEKLDRSNFLEGSKLLGTYLYEIQAQGNA